MALQLNLHHEIDKQKALNRRDPLKLSIYGLVAVALMFAGYYLLQFGAAHGLRSELSSLQGELDRLKSKATADQNRETELIAAAKLSENLVKRVENRFYWAPVLDILTQVVPGEVQVTKLAGDVASDKARHCTITVEGVSAGSEPRKVAEDLRRGLTEKFAGKYKNVTSKFTTLDDGKDLARVGAQQVPTALFAIQLHMQTGEDEPAPVPVRRGAAPAKKNDGGML